MGLPGCDQGQGGSVFQGELVWEMLSSSLLRILIE